MIIIDASKCGGCGSCVEVCHEDCLSLVDKKVAINYALCSTCTQCIAVCAKQALSWDGVPPVAFDPSCLPSPEQLAELFEERRSMRSFTRDKLGRDLLAEIAGYGIDAPTNNYHLRAVVVDDPEIILALDRVVLGYATMIYNTFFRSWLVFNFIRLFTTSLLETDKVKMETVIARGHNFHSYPAAIIFMISDRPVALSIDSAQFALANMMYYAQSKGIGACLFGPGRLMLDRSKAARKLLGFEKNDHIVGTLLLGYPAMKFRNKVVGKKMIIQWNTSA
jgi:NAD-dependent dihydropyrimidine dehydrogenase PreA subunit/nitroreductase